MSCVTAVDPHWLADLGGVFYSIKEKGYSARDRRVTEIEFNRKAELEAKMAEDKEREAQRIAREQQNGSGSLVKKHVDSAVKKVSTHGAVKRPIRPKRGRGF
jgi:pre-mRNA-splicing factor ATP-dependent RNA helicase DHX38/PRP16